MPRVSRYTLSTDREVRTAAAIGQRTDFRVRGTAGLQLRVTAKGTKSWALAYKSPGTGKWAKVSLGTYPSMGLAEARLRALDLASTVRAGKDPVYDKQLDALSETFESLSRRYLHEHHLRNARDHNLSRSTAEASRQLKADILPTIGRLKAANVNREHVRLVVEAIAERGSFVSADRALGLIRAIYNWACGRGWLEANPTLGLRKRNTSRAKTRVLDEGELKQFWQAIGQEQFTSVSLRDCYRLQLLTAARAGEVLGTEQVEVDLIRRIWTIPARRTKSRREHSLPLSDEATGIFAAAITRANRKAAERASGGSTVSMPSRWVFPSPSKPGAMDPHAASTGLLRLRQELSAIGIVTPFNTHDLRRTLATQLGEMGVADSIIERILNHAPRTVASRHYNHAKNQKAMRLALDEWAKRLELIVKGESPESVEGVEVLKATHPR